MTLSGRFPRLVLTLFLAALALSPLAAQGLKKLTPERIAGEPPLDGRLPTGLAWHPEGKRLTYLRPAGNGAVEFWALDLTSGREVRLLQATREIPPTQPGRGPSYAWSPRGDVLLVTQGDDLHLVNPHDGASPALTQTVEKEEFPEFSPDGKRVAFVRSGDLYVVEIASGRESRLTTTGSETILNGRLDWVYEEELGSRSGKAYTWSPDSRAIAYLQLDQARVPTFPIVDFLPVRNEVQFQRYPKAGSPNSVVRVGVVGLSREGTPGPERLVSFDPDDMYVVPDLAWTPDSRAVAFSHLNREQNALQLRLLPVPEAPSAPLGTARPVLDERCSTWVNTLGAPRFLADGQRFVWLSERDGFAHVYLCDTAGACRNVAQGPWTVDRPSFIGSSGLLAVDERTGFVFYTGTEEDPRERHLYRVRLDGTGRTRLTREDGTHRVLLSPDARFYADTWSDAATPPRLWVTTPDGTRRFLVEDNRTAPILEYERAAAEWVDLKAKDGTPLHGMLLKPADFDPKRRYPVVVSVYGGPHAQVVLNSWTAVSPFEHMLASRGFLVWSLDNRGSSGRGHAFEAALFRDMGRVELEDQLVGVNYLKSLPFVDPSRIGITGWSYGGYMTLYALTHAPDVFKAGVAGAPVTDWKFYDTIYTERYMGTPQSNPKGYEASSPLARAADLKAELLLIHGSADDNVHLANTLAFADALIKAGRPHALLIHPGQMHGFRAKENRIARDAAILRFFETHLKP
jgi:dipeptidyl-peptidase-4